MVWMKSSVPRVRTSRSAFRPSLALILWRPTLLRSYFWGSKNMPKSSFLLDSRVAGSPGRIFLKSSLAASSLSSVWSLIRVSEKTLPVTSASGKHTSKEWMSLARNISRWVWRKGSLASMSTSPVPMFTMSWRSTAPSSISRETGTSLMPAFSMCSRIRRVIFLSLARTTSLVLGCFTSSSVFLPWRWSPTATVSLPFFR